jgi:hypothetical protein
MFGLAQVKQVGGFEHGNKLKGKAESGKRESENNRLGRTLLAVTICA